MGCEDRTRTEFLEMIAAFQRIHGKVKFPGISRSEFVMLQMIFSEGDGKNGLRITDLAAHLQISSPAVSRMIKGLADKGFVVRKRDKEDRRITYVSLTGQGEKKRTECMEQMYELGERSIKIMGEKDMRELIRLSMKLIHSVEDEIDRSDGNENMI